MIILDKDFPFVYNTLTKHINGRLAQLVAHPLDVREVTGSSPVTTTIPDGTLDTKVLRVLSFFMPVTLKTDAKLRAKAHDAAEIIIFKDLTASRS